MLVLMERGLGGLDGWAQVFWLGLMERGFLGLDG
jgi:hypothetical protein